MVDDDDRAQPSPATSEAQRPSPSAQELEQAAALRRTKIWMGVATLGVLAVVAVVVGGSCAVSLAKV
jgi:hypothetical protein